MKNITKLLQILLPKYHFVPHVVPVFQRQNSYTYYRLTIQDVYGVGSQVSLYEIELRENVTDATSFLTGSTATASSYVNANTTPEKAIDGDLSFSWQNALGQLPAWIQFALSGGIKKTPGLVSFNVSVGFQNGVLEASNDGVNWTTLLSISPSVLRPTGNNATNNWYHWPLKDGLEFWRILISNVVSNGTQAQMSQFEIRGSIGGANLLTGGVPTAKSIYAASSPSNALDGTLSTIWSNNITSGVDTIGSGNTSWWGYILPEGVSIGHIGEIYIQGNGTVGMPNEFIIQHSSDKGQSWTDFYTTPTALRVGGAFNRLRLLFDNVEVNQANVRLLMHCDGTDGDETTVDVKGHELVRTTTTTTLSNAQAKSGSTSIAVLGEANNGWKTVNYESDFNIDPNTICTIEFWIYPTTVGTQNYLFTYRPNAGSLLYIYMRSDGGIGAYVFGSGITSGAANQPLFQINQWNHVALGVDLLNDRCYLSLNGQTLEVSVLSENTSSTAAELYFGRYAVNGHPNCPGYFDECRITWNQILYPGNYVNYPTFPATPYPDA
jgi:hypothetical protein